MNIYGEWIVFLFAIVICIVHICGKPSGTRSPFDNRPLSCLFLGIALILAGHFGYEKGLGYPREVATLSSGQRYEVVSRPTTDAVYHFVKDESGQVLLYRIPYRMIDLTTPGTFMLGRDEKGKMKLYRIESKGTDKTGYSLDTDHSS